MTVREPSGPVKIPPGVGRSTSATPATPTKSAKPASLADQRSGRWASAEPRPGRQERSKPQGGDDDKKSRVFSRLRQSLRAANRTDSTAVPVEPPGEVASEGTGKDRRPSRKRRREGGVALVQGWLRGAFFDNPALKFVALVLAITLFILVNTNKDALIGVDVSVVYTMPEDRVLISDKVDVVRVTIKGSWRRIKRFDEREIDRIHVDLTNLRSGEYRFPRNAIRLPPGLALLDIKPESIPLRFEPKQRATVPVHVPTVGRTNRGYKLDKVEVKPSHVPIRGAASAIESIKRLTTRELDLSGRSESFAETLSLVAPRPEPILEILDGSTVEVQVSIIEELTESRFESVAVNVRGGPGYEGPPLDRYTVEPPVVDVVLRGPVLSVEAFEDCVAFVEVYPDDAAGRVRKAAVRIQDAPSGVGIEIVPSTVSLKLSRSQ